MVTMKDIMNMGRKIKRSNNPKTLARYQAQIDAWIAELAADQARTQTELQTLDEKIKLEEEAKAAHLPNLKRGKEMPSPKPAQKSDFGSQTKEQAVKIAEKIKMEEEAKAHQISNLKQGDKYPVPAQKSGTGKFAPVPAPKSGAGDTSKEQAKRIAEKAGVDPRKCYNYFEFERFHLRRSRA